MPRSHPRYIQLLLAVAGWCATFGVAPAFADSPVISSGVSVVADDRRCHRSVRSLDSQHQRPDVRTEYLGNSPANNRHEKGVIRCDLEQSLLGLIRTFGTGLPVDGVPVAYGLILPAIGRLTGNLAAGGTIDSPFLWDRTGIGVAGISVIPEPGTSTLLGAGLLALAARRYVRRWPAVIRPSGTTFSATANGPCTRD